MSAPCIATSPAYTPKFESMSDDDLDVLEIVYWAIATGIDPGNTSPTYAAVQSMLAPAACWQTMSPRQRRERVIAKMLDLSACWDAATMRQVLRLTNAKTTRDQRKAAIDWLRWSGLSTVNCTSIP